MKRIFTFFILTNLAMAMFAQTPSGLKGTLDSDKEALLEIYSALNGPNWTKTIEGVDISFNWSAETDILDFVGVTVGTMEGVDRVTEIDLSSVNELEGNIPVAFGKLDGLSFIDLSSNLYLTGPIPDEFYDMISLKTLRMANTSISGTISDKIGQITQLKTIFMEKNTFMTGGIPDGIGKCVKLDYIRVADNIRMTGKISDEITKCTALTVLQCERSNFSGKIPAGLATMANLKYLNMNYNNFTSSPDFAAPGARFPSTMMEIHQNYIPFGDLLPMKNYTRNSAKDCWYYRFIDQKPGTPLTEDTLKVKLNAPLVIDIDVLQPNNGGVSFRWFFNDAVISTSKVLNLTMSDITVGNYYCEITTDLDILNSGVCPACQWQDSEATINPRPAFMATNTTAKLVVIADLTTGINSDNLNKGLSIIKDSERGSFTLMISDESIFGNAYHVIDINGRVLQTGKVQSNMQKLELNTPNGIYFFQYGSEGKKAVKKLIIN